MDMQLRSPGPGITRSIYDPSAQTVPLTGDDKRRAEIEQRRQQEQAGKARSEYVALLRSHTGKRLNALRDDDFERLTDAGKQAGFETAQVREHLDVLGQDAQLAAIEAEPDADPAELADLEQKKIEAKKAAIEAHLDHVRFCFELAPPDLRGDPFGNIAAARGDMMNKCPWLRDLRGLPIVSRERADTEKTEEEHAAIGNKIDALKTRKPQAQNNRQSLRLSRAWLFATE